MRILIVYYALKQEAQINKTIWTHLFMESKKENVWFVSASAL